MFVEVDVQQCCLYVVGQYDAKMLQYGFQVTYGAIINNKYLKETDNSLRSLVFALEYGDHPLMSQHQDMPSWSIH